MPWLAVDKAYEFDGPGGTASLLDLFEGRRQLIIYRAFLEPGVRGWPEHACVGCSMIADHVGNLAHLHARDTTLAFASRAPQPDIARVKARMGWAIPWYTMTDGFDADFGVDEWHGTNAFIRDGDRVYRTYFINNRGDEAMGNTWTYLDMTALGRQEQWEDSPEGYPQTPPYAWWNWHDEYGNDAQRRLRPNRRPSPPRSGTVPRRPRPRPAAARRAADGTGPAGTRRTGRTRRRFPLRWSRIVPRSTGYRASSASSTARWVTGPGTRSSTSPPASASARRCAGSTTRIMTASGPRRTARRAGPGRPAASGPRRRPRRTPARRWCRSRSRSRPGSPRPSRRAAR